MRLFNSLFLFFLFFIPEENIFYINLSEENIIFLFMRKIPFNVDKLGTISLSLSLSLLIYLVGNMVLIPFPRLLLLLVEISR